MAHEGEVLHQVERLRYGWDKASVEARVLWMKELYRQSAEDSQGLFVQALVGGERGEPMVELRWDDKLLQWTPEQAVEHALQLIACAEAALHDAFLLHYLESRVGVDRERGLLVLLEMRAWRQRRAELPEDPEGVTG
jgi:hypothetical protein